MYESFQFIILASSVSFTDGNSSDKTFLAFMKNILSFVQNVMFFSTTERDVSLTQCSELITEGIPAVSGKLK